MPNPYDEWTENAPAPAQDGPSKRYKSRLAQYVTNPGKYRELTSRPEKGGATAIVNDLINRPEKLPAGTTTGDWIFYVAEPYESDDGKTRYPVIACYKQTAA